MSTEIHIRLSDGFREVYHDGVMVAEIHPADRAQFTSGNWHHDVVVAAASGHLPGRMAPRKPLESGAQQ